MTDRYPHDHDRLASILDFLMTDAGIDREDIAALFLPDGTLSPAGKHRLKAAARAVVPKPFHLLEDGTLTPREQAAYWRTVSANAETGESFLEQVTERFADGRAQAQGTSDQPVYLDPRAFLEIAHPTHGARARLVHGRDLFLGLLRAWNVPAGHAAWEFAYRLMEPHVLPEAQPVRVLPAVHAGPRERPCCLLVRPEGLLVRRADEAASHEKDTLAGLGFLALLGMHARRRRPGEPADGPWPQRRWRAIVPGFRRTRPDGGEDALHLEADHTGTGWRDNLRAPADIHLSWQPAGGETTPDGGWRLPTCRLL